MPERDKVCDSLYCCIWGMGLCDCCSYKNSDGPSGCQGVLMEDALTLLKAQEPVEPKWRKGYAYCGQCGYKLHWIVDLNNFCPNCGRAVKWTSKPSIK